MAFASDTRRPSVIGLVLRRALLTMLIVASGVSGTFATSTTQGLCDDVVSIASGAAATPAAALEASFPEDGGTLTIFAAASLVDAFAEFSETLERQHPGLEIVIEAAGSQALVTQLQEGASADVLATADWSTMDAAADSGLISGEPRTFTSNRLVIVTPLDNPLGIESIDDLAGDDVNLVVANASVPAGKYARQAICAYDASGEAPGGFAGDVAANIVSEEENVRSVLTKVQLGEADAGIVYASDAVASDKAGVPVNQVEFPESVPTMAEYPIATLAAGDDGLANAFIAAVLSEAGQAVLNGYGFGG